MLNVLGAVMVVLAMSLAACASSGASRSPLARLLAGEPRVEYILHLDDPQTQTLRVSVVLRGVSGESVDLSLPVWRPGRYQVLDPAGTIHGAAAVSGSPRTGQGRALPVAKVDKSTWRIETGGTDELTFSYSVYANSLADRTRHVDASHAFLSPGSVLVHDPSRRDEPALVRLEAPEGWRVATGLSPAGDDPMVLLAPGYDILVDSPIEVGSHDLLAFDVDGVPHEIAVWGPWNRGRYEERMTEDFAKIVREQARIFGDMPYDRYVYIVHVTPAAGGGTEHFNSTVMQTGRGSFRSESAYRRFLGLVSHEMFHTWNIKRLRPAGLAPYDYSRENYTDLLWVAEGTTSYYDKLVLARTGINKPQAYLDALAGQVSSIRQRPGAQVQTLAESSFDAWIKFSKPNPDSVNTTVSFYDKGALASLILDLEIRSRSQNRASLDEVMRALYREFPLGGPGFTEADMRRLAAELAGTPLDDVFDVCVHSTADMPFEAAFLAAGLELSLETNSPDEGEERRDERAYLGFNLEDKGGIVSVTSVLIDGPAWAAGLNSGDEILSINGFRARGSDPTSVLDRVGPGDRLSLMVARRDEVLAVDFTADARPNARWRLARLKSPSELQKATYASWLGHPWPEAQAAAVDHEPDIVAVLDDWHDAAAEADLERYFAHFDESAVFMGTDASERWTVEAFRAFCEPYFSKGKAWTFIPRDRRIEIRGDVAWFDELLDSEHMGVCRGSGVLRRASDRWRLTQYNLSIPVPNDLADDFIRRIRDFDAKP